jgi:YebC/PmpR family DNA-binding regulatory protein
MAGHSHWARIKRAKAVTDARRGQQWSKLSRRIIVAAKTGGPNPDENLSLRYAIDDAKAANMPKDTIANAIKKGAGGTDGQNYEQVIYEGYGPAGVAVMIDCLTDNRNRTVPEIRKAFERAGGQLGNSNCVAWMFTQKGTFTIAADRVEEDALFEVCLEAGADDVARMGDVYEVTCEVADFAAIKNALAEKGIETLSAEIAMIPNTTVAVGEDKAQQVLNLMEALEEHDDVQNVYANFDIPDEVAAKLKD